MVAGSLRPVIIVFRMIKSTFNGMFVLGILTL